MRIFAERRRRTAEITAMPRFITMALTALMAACASGPTVGQTDREAPPDERPDVPGAFEATIISPNGTESALAGSPLRFEARFTFGGNPVSPERVEWRSSLKGTLGAGNPLDGVVLTPGEHTISVEAVFEGERATARSELGVGEMAVRIESPANGALFELGEAISFSARAQRWNGGAVETLVDGDPGPGQARADFEWKIDANDDDDDDLLRATTRTFESTELSAGSQTVELEVTVDGLSGNASVTFSVLPQDFEPVRATISAPECGRVYTNDEDLEFIGELSTGASASWREALTGLRGSGGRFYFGDGAEPGKHRVELTATDALGTTATASCDVTFVENGGSITDLFPDSSALNPSALAVTALDGSSPILVGRESGLTIFFEDGAAAQYDSSSLGYADDLAIAATASESELVHLGTSTGLARCNRDEVTLSDCAVVDAGAVLDMILLDSDRSILVVLQDSKIRVEKVGDEAVELPWSQLALDGARRLASRDGGILVATATELCEISDVPALLEEPGGARCVLRFSLLDSALSGATLQSLTVDDSTVWLGTDDGLLRWRPESGSVLALTAPPLGGANVLSTAIGRNDALWIGTESGLIRYDQTLGTVVELGSLDWGGASERVAALILSDEGTLVIGSDDGLYFYRGP